MSHFDPQVDDPLPSEYVAYCASLRDDIRIGRSVIYKWSKPPSVLGRPGDENFWKSLLIGRHDSGQTILLTCESDGCGQHKRWEYRIAGYAEWKVFETFQTFAELREFLITYRGVEL